jgi:hypothetical protein
MTEQPKNLISESELDFGSNGTAILRVEEKDVLPQEAFGFTIKTFVARYPLDAPTSHRLAVYAEFTPQTDAIREKLRRRNTKEMKILGTAPLTSEAAAEIKRNPQGKTAELAALGAISEAGKFAKIVHDA